MRVAVLAVHPRSVASTRLRVLQFAPYFEQAGIDLVLWSFFREADLPDWFGSSQWRRLRRLVQALLRAPGAVRVVRGSAVVVVQREALPLGPPVLELLAARGRRLVWDVDDAVWSHVHSPTAGRVPQWLRATGGKYEVLCRRADEVWAGSDVLAAWCRQRASSVRVVPTVVPVAAQRPSASSERTVGWIGSHSTGLFLEAVLPAVASVVPPPQVLAVGADAGSPGLAGVQVTRWSQDAEDDALRTTRVGLYPIDRDHPLAEGKCGLKAVLYMAQGIPPVVTPTTTNAAVVRDGVEGLHAGTPQEWTTAVQRLLDDDALWEQLSRAAHERARSHFSVQVWGPRLADSLVTLGSP